LTLTSGKLNPKEFAANVAHMIALSFMFACLF